MLTTDAAVTIGASLPAMTAEQLGRFAD